MAVHVIAPAAPGSQAAPLDFSSPIGAINSWGMECGSYGATSAGFDSWNNGINFAANRARFVPFVLNETVIVDGFGWYNGATSSGNIDIGIYDQFGALLVSMGSQPQGTALVVTTFAVPATILRQGNYFLALVQDNTTGLLRGINQNQAVQGLLGCKQMASAFPLPAAATFAEPSVGGYPYVSAFTQTVF